MKKPSILQFVIYGVCILGAGVALLMFSGKISVGTDTKTEIKGNVTMWGILPTAAVKKMTVYVESVYPDLKIQYVQKNPSTMQSELVEALASGKGPDLITVSTSDIIRNRDRLFAIPYASLPLQTFQNAFIDQGSLFATPDGIVALPLVVDPLVMYYNRDLLTSSFVVQPPTTWDEIVALNKQVTKKDDAGTLSVSTVALGTFDNITHAKDLLAMLTLQAGGSLVGFDPTTKKYTSTLAQANREGTPVGAALRFLAGFANPSDPDKYSWNASLPNDRSQFIAGKLAVYFGSASELAGIRRSNPNLNYGVSMMPQSARFPTKATYGKMIGVGIIKMSKNSQLAFLAANQLAQKGSVESYLQDDVTYAPARKDLLSQSFPGDVVKTLSYQSAIISRGFLDPDPAQTTSIFKRVIDQVTAGIMDPEQAAFSASSLLAGVLSSVQK